MWIKLAYLIQFKLLVARHSEVTCHDLLSVKLFNIHVFIPLRYNLFKIKYLFNSNSLGINGPLKQERKKQKEEGKNRTPPPTKKKKERKKERKKEKC